MKARILVPAFILVVVAISSCAKPEAPKPLQSWLDTNTRSEIIGFVESVTDSSSEYFVAVEDRIAVFDNDGTLWSEQPVYFQLAYALDRLKEMARGNPKWTRLEPYATVLSGDQSAIMKLDRKALAEIILTTHSNQSNSEFVQSVSEWIDSARHSTTGRSHTSMVYLPMLELLDYLRTNEFDVYIVTGGGAEFVRAWAEEIYGIPMQNVVGSMLGLALEETDDGLILSRTPEIDFVNDGPGKPVGIQRAIGRRPLFAFGNSDGDLQMLQWTMAGDGKRFAGLVRHTDAGREWAYDRESHIGKLDIALDQAGANGWTVVDMKEDWSVVYPTLP